MDEKPAGVHIPIVESSSRHLSAFETSLNLKFQADAPKKEAAIPKAGDPCPQCQSVKIDYDGLLNLSCPDCGYTLAGCFT